MSKGNSRARKSTTPPHHRPGFASLEALSSGKCADCIDMPKGAAKNHSHGPCPDCNLRGALTPTTLLPVHDRDPFRKKALKQGRVVGIRFSPSSVEACETCKGTGSIPLYGKARLDPYADNGWLVRGPQVPA